MSILIGHAGHPEVIGTMGQLPEGSVSLVETVEDADVYVPADPDNLGYRHPDDAFRRRYGRRDRAAAGALPQPDGAGRRFDLLCHDEPPGSGEAGGARLRSLHHRRRAEFVQFQAAGRSGTHGPVRRSRSSSSAPPRSTGTRSARSRRVGLSAGASAPEVIVNEIIEAFRERFDATVELAETVEENEHFLVNRELRSIELTIGRHGVGEWVRDRCSFDGARCTLIRLSQESQGRPSPWAGEHLDLPRYSICLPSRRGRAVAAIPVTSTGMRAIRRRPRTRYMLPVNPLFLDSSAY